jgi:hypothetical protein
VYEPPTISLSFNADTPVLNGSEPGTAVIGVKVPADAAPVMQASVADTAATRAGFVVNRRGFVLERFIAVPSCDDTSCAEKAS